MVKGLDKFKEAFANFTDNYVVIGGTACDIVLQNTNMRPRATDDIDMILVVEKITPEFASALWDFIIRGGYHNKERKRGEGEEPVPELYRFENPKEGYPIKIELLSRHSDLLDNPSGFHLEPIPFGEEISSLSAIMLDNDYYDLTIQNSLIDENLRIASPVALICLKAKAYLNLLADKEAGKQVNSKDIKKHKTDVLKLIATASIPEPVVVPDSVLETIQKYADNIMKSLPSQSLEDALDSTSDDIATFIKILTESFTTSKS
mgnify:FL=1